MGREHAAADVRPAQLQPTPRTHAEFVPVRRETVVGHSDRGAFGSFQGSQRREHQWRGEERGERASNGQTAEGFHEVANTSAEAVTRGAASWPRGHESHE